MNGLPIDVPVIGQQPIPAGAIPVNPTAAMCAEVTIARVYTDDLETFATAEVSDYTIGFTILAPGLFERIAGHRFFVDEGEFTLSLYDLENDIEICLAAEYVAYTVGKISMGACGEECAEDEDDEKDA